jgi:uncharacterized protein (DUF2249 family)
MKTNAAESILDVRDMAPRLRHPTIFNTWAGLGEGEAFLLVNDHDPLPLYYQFAAEQPGRFRWEYLERGPDAWRVRLTRGKFPDPGFRPAPQASAPPCAVPSAPPAPLVLDTRPIFARGDTPCQAIDGAVASLAPGQSFVLLAPFEPVPLYAKLGQQGFSNATSQLDDGSWRIEFRPTGEVQAVAQGPIACNCHGH